MNEKYLFLLLSDTGTVLTRLIKFYTRKPYNHASIAFDSDLNEVYSFGRKKVSNPFHGGFVQEDMNSILFQQAECAIYCLSVTDEQYNEVKRCIQNFEVQKENYHYNLLGLFGVMLNKPVERKNAYFCSQFVATILKEGKIVDNEMDPSLTKPSDLPYLADFQLIFEGKLIDYLSSCERESIVSYPFFSQKDDCFQSEVCL